MFRSIANSPENPWSQSTESHATWYLSHTVTCHPAETTCTPLPQPKLVFDLATPEGCKAELTYTHQIDWFTRNTGNKR